jgi:hypothetical protein
VYKAIRGFAYTRKEEEEEEEDEKKINNSHFTWDTSSHVLKIINSIYTTSGNYVAIQ